MHPSSQIIKTESLHFFTLKANCKNNQIGLGWGWFVAMQPKSWTKPTVRNSLILLGLGLQFAAMQLCHSSSKIHHTCRGSTSNMRDAGGQEAGIQKQRGATLGILAYHQVRLGLGFISSLFLIILAYDQDVAQCNCAYDRCNAIAPQLFENTSHMQRFNIQHVRRWRGQEAGIQKQRGATRRNPRLSPGQVGFGFHLVFVP